MDKKLLISILYVITLLLSGAADIHAATAYTASLSSVTPAWKGTVAMVRKDTVAMVRKDIVPPKYRDTVPQMNIDSTVVTAERTFIRNNAGSMIYDVLSDPDSKKLKMNEFMLKLPGMSLNAKTGKLDFLDGRKYIILIDGKENMMIGNNRQYVMNLLQADYMKFIEILDPPPAQYSAYDVAINIILEKQLPKGVAGQLSANAGTNEDYGAQGDFTFRFGRFISNISYNYKYGEPRGTFYNYERDFFSDSQEKKQFYNSRNYNYSTNHDLDFNVSYEISEKTDISVFTNTDASKNTGFCEIRSYDLIDGKEQNQYETLNRNVSFMKPAFNGGIRLRHDIEHGSLILSYDLDNSDERSDHYNSGYSWSENTSSSNSAQARFMKTFGKHHINLAASYIHRKYENMSDEVFSDGNGNIWNSGLSYIQQVSAAEAIYRFNSRKIFISASLKGEYTDNSGEYLQKEISPLSYSGWALQPSVSVTYMFRNARRIGLSLGTSSMRPDITYLNPYLDDSDPMNLRQGNSGLEPEINYRSSINYSMPMLKNKMRITLSAGARYIDKAIETFQSVNENNISYTTFRNMGNRKDLSASLRWSYRIHKAVSLSTDFRYKWAFADNGNGAIYRNRGFNGSFILTGNPWKGGSYDMVVLMQSLPKNIQDINETFNMTYSMGIYQAVLKNNLTLGIRISDPFKGRYVIEKTTAGENFTTFSSQERLGREVFLYVRWIFGKLKDRMASTEKIATDRVRQE